jgi:hypothetical protein
MENKNLTTNKTKVHFFQQSGKMNLILFIFGYLKGNEKAKSCGVSHLIFRNETIKKTYLEYMEAYKQLTKSFGKLENMKINQIRSAYSSNYSNVIKQSILLDIFLPEFLKLSSDFFYFGYEHPNPEMLIEWRSISSFMPGVVHCLKKSNKIKNFFIDHNFSGSAEDILQIISENLSFESIYFKGKFSSLFYSFDTKMVKALQYKKNLKYLYFDGCQLLHDYMNGIGKIITSNPQIIRLNLVQSYFTRVSCMETLSSALMSTKIQELLLSKNHLEKDAALKFFTNLKNITSLKILYMDYCKLDDEPLIALFSNFPDSLEKVSLIKNLGTNKKTIETLCSQLIKRETLMQIDLRKNNFSSESYNILVENNFILRSNLKNKRHFVDFRDNKFGNLSEEINNELELLAGELLSIS